MNEAHKYALDVINAWVDEPREGLPEEFFLFISRFTPLVNVDLLIRDECRRTLLTWRDDETYGAGWHIPGGIIRYKETAEDRIRATAALELGSEIRFEPRPILIEQSIEPNRRERGHFVSLVYRCYLLTPPDPARRYESGRPLSEQWAWFEDCPADLIEAQAAYRRLF
jgi:colanic acid biosynthesis protein WcaH